MVDLRRYWLVGIVGLLMGIAMLSGPILIEDRPFVWTVVWICAWAALIAAVCVPLRRWIARRHGYQE